MNILFMTLSNIVSVENSEIYSDFLRCFRNHGHEVYIMTPYEKRYNKETCYEYIDRVHMLHVKTGNITKAKNLIEKGIATLSIEGQYVNAIKKYLNNVKFDLVMYSTPPITFHDAIKFIKNRDGAKSYLLLKDIFPQNAVDLGMMSTSGLKSIIYKYFRHKEKELYKISDYIGCMSQANVEYVLKHNFEVNPRKVEVCPNSIEPVDMSATVEERIAIRQKYGIPLDKKVFVYGGNLGKPQGIDFLIKCLQEAKYTGVYFLIVGDGTEYEKLEQYVKHYKPEHVKLMQRLPKEDYDKMIGSCDLGMIFLDYRFTIPNFPSRLLAYMQAKLPVLAVTDVNTDVGKVIVEGGFGWWCEADDEKSFVKTVEYANQADLEKMKVKEWQYLCNEYTCEKGYEIVMNKFK